MFGLYGLRLLGVLLFCGLGLQLSVARAGDTDAASAGALLQTQQLLQNSDQRDKAVSENPMAQTVDGQVKALAGNPQVTDEIYKLSGQILEDLVKETGGDPVKMMQIMSQAQSDPKALSGHLNDKDKAALRDIASQIEAAPTMKQPVQQSDQRANPVK